LNDARTFAAASLEQRMICISSASSLPSLSDQWFVIHQENSDFVATADLQSSALIHSGPSLSQVAFFSGNRRENVVRFSIEPESSRASENNVMTDGHPCARYPSSAPQSGKYLCRHCGWRWSPRGSGSPDSPAACVHFQEGSKRLPILGEHPDEPYPISHLGIAGNHGGGDQDGSFDGKLQIQISPDWEWENCLDVAAAQAQIGGIATNPPAARVSLYFDRHTHFHPCVFATVIPVALAHGLWPSLRSAHPRL
jgi:hypothetical protein